MYHPLEKNAISGLAILAVFLTLFFLSGPFEYGAEQPRPVLLVVGLLIVAAIFAFGGLGFAIQTPASQSKKLITIVIGLALSIRLVAIFTTPILEIDYYRYVWDGKVVCEGVSPYRFSPAQVSEIGISRDQDLARLGELSTRSESNHVVLSRIHYDNYTTLYPPVSQLVFAATMKLVPETASVEAHVIAIKIAMTLFDIATMLIVIGLLKLTGTHPGWLIAYAWNPLVIKEIANSGHLDSIATFFVVLTLYLVARQKIFPSAKFSKWLLLLAGVTLGLGVGAKLYPVVLFPALLVALVKRKRHFGNSHRRNDLVAAAFFSVAFALTSCCTLLPMFHKHLPTAIGQSISQSGGQPVSGEVPSNVSGEQTKSQDGFDGFFSSWRMNDPIFSTVYFNLKSDRGDSVRPWFVFTGKRWRGQLNEQFRSLGFDGENTAYLMARILTLSLFCCFYLWQLGKLYYSQKEDQQWIADLVGRVLLFLALFLFLQPTVNPWYFVWVAPLTCLTNNRGWLLASGILMLYYSRFWFKSLAGTYVLLGYNFNGSSLFDHCFVFVEFGLVAALLIYFCYRKKPDEHSGINNAV